MHNQLPGSPILGSVLAKHVLGIDHLAIAVPDIEKSIIWFTSVLGFALKDRRRTEGAKTGMLSAVLESGALNFVLLQGTSEDSQVSRFIEHYGAGVQHIAIRVDDIDAVAQELREGGFEFDTTIIEGSGLRQIFSKRNIDSGLMFEFIERSALGFSDANVTALFSQLEEKDTY